jgi:hypothetical protein
MTQRSSSQNGCPLALWSTSKEAFPSSFQRNISTTNEKFSRTRYSRLTKNPAPEGGFDGYLIKRKVASGALFSGSLPLADSLRRLSV